MQIALMVDDEKQNTVTDNKYNLTQVAEGIPGTWVDIVNEKQEIVTPDGKERALTIKQIFLPPLESIEQN
jgi:hypothetical protein